MGAFLQPRSLLPPGDLVPTDPEEKARSSSREKSGNFLPCPLIPLLLLPGWREQGRAGKVKDVEGGDPVLLGFLHLVDSPLGSVAKPLTSTLSQMAGSRLGLDRPP